MKKVITSGLIAGIAILIVSQILNYLLGLLSPSIQLSYQNPALFRPWSDPLMSLYFIYPFVLGITLSFFWQKAKEVFKGKGINRAVNFALWLFLVATIPGMFITYSSFQVSLGLVLVWAINGLIEVLVAGLVFDKLNR